MSDKKPDELHSHSTAVSLWDISDNSHAAAAAADLRSGGGVTQTADLVGRHHFTDQLRTDFTPVGLQLH